MPGLTRRSLLKLAGLGTAAGTAAFGTRAASAKATAPEGVPGQGQSYDAMQHAAHTMGPVGRVPTDRFDPAVFLRSWNFSQLAPAERARFYRETPRPDGTLLREYQLHHRRSRDRDRAWHLLSGLDLQRPGARADAARDRRRSRPRHLRQPGLASAHDSFPRLASARDGRLAARAPGDARRADSSTSSTPIPSACTCITATPSR